MFPKFRIFINTPYTCHSTLNTIFNLYYCIFSIGILYIKLLLNIICILDYTDFEAQFLIFSAMRKTNQNSNQLIQLAIGNEYWFWLMSDWFQSDSETQFKTVVAIYSLWLRKGILFHTTCIQCMKRERSDCNNCNICTVHIGSQFAYTNTK